MDEDKKNRLKTVVELLREERRKYNNLLMEVINGREEYNAEDLMRLVGTLEAAYNHALASLASDGDEYCLLKHIPYAIILVGELEKPDVEPLYEIITIISNGKIEPCASCRREERSNNGSTNRNVNDGEAEAISGSGGAVGDSVSDN